MGARVAARQLLRWTVRRAPTSTSSSTSSTLSPPRFGRALFQPQYISCSLLCSSTSQSLVQAAQHEHEATASDLSLDSLLDMGFTDTQAQQICDAVFRDRRRNATKHALSTLTALFVLGLSPATVLKVLEKCPELYAVKESQLKQRVGNLRKLGLGEGSLQRVVAYYPQILTVPVKTVKHVVAFLKEKCLFTVLQVTDILRESPAIVLEDLDHLEYKFQYVYFRMGVKQAEMVKARLFRFTLDEVRHRHCFLDRRGLYHTPDKKGQTIIINPKLDSILSVNEDTFLARVAMASSEEYDVFKRLIARESQEEELQRGSIEADSDSYAEEDEEEGKGDEEEDEDEDEEDEETGGKSGYRKWRKK